MGLKALVLVVACFLLINTKSSAVAPAASPVLEKSPPPPPKFPSPPPLLKSPPPSPSPVKSPPPPSPTKSPPPPPPPIYKAPPPPPPVYKAPPPPTPPRNTKECFPLCVVRCKYHSRKNVCLRACVTCCDRCKCVPPGQYGNKEKCGDGKCYARMTTRGGKPKCP